jgi:hypothetical protein
VSADVLYCDEAAFMNLDVFYQVIIPLFEMKRAALICISSPLDSYNFYSKLLKTRNPATGELIFRVYQLRLACDRCMKTEHPTRCQHNLKYIPPWKSEDKLTVVKIIMQELESVLERESFGIVSDASNSLFSKLSQKQLKNGEPYEPMRDTCANAVLITCDPNQGGPNELALVATVYQRGQYVIVGMVSHECKTVEEVETLFRSFLRKLRAHPWLHLSTFMFVAERNTGRESGHLKNLFMSERGPNYAIRQDPKHDYGWWTTNEEKMRYAYQTRDALAGEAVLFVRDMVCFNPMAKLSLAASSGAGGEEMVRDEMYRLAVDKLFDQMARYHEREIRGLSAASVPRSVVSGKMDADGKLMRSMNDDLMFCLTFNIGIWKKIQQHLVPMDYSILEHHPRTAPMLSGGGFMSAAIAAPSTSKWQ